MSLTDDYAALVCDLDGVVYRGHLAVPHAVDALRACAIQCSTRRTTPPGPRRTWPRTCVTSGSAVSATPRSSRAPRPGPVTLPSTCPRARVLAVGGKGVFEALRREGWSPCRRERHATERTVLPSSPAGLRRRRHRRRPGGGGVRRPGRCGSPRTRTARCRRTEEPRPATARWWRPWRGPRGRSPSSWASHTRRCTCCVPRWLTTTRRRSLPWGTGSTPTSRGRSRRGWTPSSSSPAWTRRRLSQQRRPACVPPTCSRTCAACTRHTRRCRAATGGGSARATGVASWTGVAGRGEGRRDHRGVACCSCRGARRARRRCPRRAGGRRLVSEVGSRQ